MSNSIDEAREGRGNKIVVTRFEDCSVEIQDFGAGIPVDFNKAENEENWKLLFCEMYAGGKYDNGADNYEYSLGLNGLGLCVHRNMLRNIWMPKFIATVIATLFILNTGKMWTV